MASDDIMAGLHLEYDLLMATLNITSSGYIEAVSKDHESGKGVLKIDYVKKLKRLKVFGLMMI